MRKNHILFFSNLIKSFCCFIICACICLISSSVPLQANTFSWQFSDIVSYPVIDMQMDYNETITVLGLDGDRVCAKQITNHSSCSAVTLTLASAYTSYAVAGSKLYFATQKSDYSSGSEKNWVEISVYDFSTDSISLYTINNLSMCLDTKFIVSSNGRYYFINEKNHRELLCYSSNNSLLYSHKFDENLLQLALSTNGETVYALSSSSVYGTSCNQSTINHIGSHSLLTPIALDQRDFAVDLTGKVVNFQSPSYVYLESTRCYGELTGGVSGKYFLRGYHNQILGYNLSTQSESLVYTLSSTVDFMRSTQSHLVTFSAQDGTLTFIDKNDLNYPAEPKPTAPPNASSQPSDRESKPSPSSQGQGNTPSSSADPGGTSAPDLSVSSSKYTINHGSYLITILPGHTIANCKQNLSYGSLSPAFFDYSGNSKKSGTIGTGAKCEFYYSSKLISTYHFITLGDLTGEGNVNSRDMATIKKHLLGTTDLSFYPYIAADCNQDGNVDVIDLLKIAKMASG